MSETKLRRIALVGGGTAGHVYPAMAIADAYRQTVAKVEFFFFGTAHGIEAQLIPQHGYSLTTLRAAPAMRVSFKGKLLAAQRLFTETLAARRLLKDMGVKLVIGFGGFATPCVLLAARSLGLCTAIYEANILPGRANRLLEHMADRIYCNFTVPGGRFFTHQCACQIGYPLRPEIVGLNAYQRSPPSNTASQPIRILITGGSEGSPFLNQNAPELMGALAHRGLLVAVRHQTGTPGLETVRKRYDQLGIAAHVSAYIDDMAAAYRQADFAITCAGIGTLAELTHCGIPALIVPLASAADDHQLLNAIKFNEISQASWTREADWQTDDLAELIVPVLTIPDRWLAASRLMRQAQRHMPLNAASKVVADCEAMMSNRW